MGKILIGIILIGLITGCTFDENKIPEIEKWVQENHPEATYKIGRNTEYWNGIEVEVYNISGTYIKYMFWEDGSVKIKEEGYYWEMPED